VGMTLDKDYCFESERLSFRGITAEDAETIVGWRNNPDNYKNFLNANPITLESHLAWFQRYLNDSTRYDFMIIENGKSIGTCGLSAIKNGTCEASYMIGDMPSRGKGYAKEALKAVSEVAFTKFGVNRIELRILPHNLASTRVALGGGFSEREIIFAKERTPDTSSSE
jgi:[ribosomal protein S5]-alanine N-acetyltransferase